MGSGLGPVDGDVDSAGATVGVADGSGVASCDEQAANTRPEDMRTTTEAREKRIVELWKHTCLAPRQATGDSNRDKL